MLRIPVIISLLLLLLSACSWRSGYETVRQMQLQDCLQNSPDPLEDCQDMPEYDQYQQDLGEQYPDNVKK